MIFQKFTTFFISLTIHLVFINNSVKCETELKMLHVFFRHGDKIPHREYHNYPNDPHGNHSYYPISDGGLTNEGKMREYKIGKVLRDWYDDFFGPFYSTDDIYGTATNYPRTQMSLQLVLAGLFPPVGQQNWNNNLKWQPTGYETDNVMSFTETCPMYKTELKKFLQCEDAKRLIEEHKNTFDYLTKHSGKLVDNTETVYQLYSVIKEEEAQGLKQPEWTSKVYPYPMKDILKLNLDLRSYTTKLKRLSGGVMLRRVTEDIKALCNDSRVNRSGQKAFFFSGHESNVASLSRTLGTGEPQIPEYGSTIIIETLKDREENSTYYVRIVLWTGVSEKRIIQKIPGCTELCPLNKFLDLLINVTADDYDAKCCVKPKNSKNNSSPKNIIFSKTIFFIIQSSIIFILYP